MAEQHKIRINHSIDAHLVRVIDENRELLGVLEKAEAIRIAKERGLDLIEVSANTDPPVCKISDFSKFRYQMQKKLHDSKKKQKIVEVKEIKVRPTIAYGDYMIKLRNAKRFLKEGNKIRISLIFKGREITHDKLGFALMEKFKADLAEDGKIYLQPKIEGRQIVMLINPA